MSTVQQISELRRDFERLRSDNRRLQEENRSLRSRLIDVKKDVRSLESHLTGELACVRESVRTVQYTVFDLEDDFMDVHGRVGRRFRSVSRSPDSRAPDSRSYDSRERSRSPSPRYRPYAYMSPSVDVVSSLEDTAEVSPKKPLRDRYIDDEALVA